MLCIRNSIRLTLWCLILLGLTTPGWAQEAQLIEAPAPDSLAAVGSAVERGREDGQRDLEVYLPRIKRALRNAPPFLRDARLQVRFRAYAYDQENTQSGQIKEATTMGGSLFAESGALLGGLVMGAEYYTSRKLYGPIDHDGSGLLLPGQVSFGVLGRLYAQLTLGGHELKIYRQSFNLPYVNRSDSRMVPNTFEAAMYRGGFPGSQDEQTVTYGLGYLTTMKKKNSDRFVSMSQATDPDITEDRPMIVGGGHISTDAFAFGAFDYFVDDVLNTFYSELRLTGYVTKKSGAQLSIQYTDQQTVGDTLMTDAPFHGRVAAAKIVFGLGPALMTVAASTVADDADIKSPYGSYPGYTSMMIRDFKRAGPEAAVLSMAANLGVLGLTGLSLVARYGYGLHAIDPGSGDEPPKKLPEEQELDVTVDYRVDDGRFRGLWLRVRAGRVEFMGSPDEITNLRLILNQELPFL